MGNINDAFNNTNKRKFVKHSIEEDDFDEQIIEMIGTTKVPFVNGVSMNKKDYAGWKLTITGKNVADAIYLYKQLGLYLKRINQPFKMGTLKLITSGNKEQSVKLMTIYIKKNTKVDELVDDIKYYLKYYNDDSKLNHNEHLFGAVWKRTDIDEYGNYIPAQLS